LTHLVMFDIDGTLVDSTGFDGDRYAEAVRSVLGVDVDTTWRSYRNVTDSGILEELLDADGSGRPREELRAAVKARFVAATRAHLAREPHVLREIAGARALLETLLRAPGVRVAIATGGWAETATLKLAAIGVDPATITLSTASDAIERTRIMQLAEGQALGGEPASRRTYFGDGAWDQRASAALGYRFIAVGRAVDHDPRFDDFRDRAAVLACLDAAL
jgi:phosphoglycolate phosphatase-like HAD superfamily hydrolase